MENLFEYVILGILASSVVMLDIWAIRDIGNFPLDKGRKKWIWTNVVMLMPLLGGFLYWSLGRKDLIAINS